MPRVGGKKKEREREKTSDTTTICLRVVFSASQSLRRTKLMGEIV